MFTVPVTLVVIALLMIISVSDESPVRWAAKIESCAWSLLVALTLVSPNRLPAPS